MLQFFSSSAQKLAGLARDLFFEILLKFGTQAPLHSCLGAWGWGP